MAACGLVTSPAWAAKPDFQIRAIEKLHRTPYTGRVYVFFSAGDAEPRLGPNWFHPEPFISYDVQDWQPGAPLEIDLDQSEVHRFPPNLKREDLQGLAAQAVVRWNPTQREVGTGPGNGFGPIIKFTTETTCVLPVDEVVPEPEFNESEWCRLLEVRSTLLSDFHGRDVNLRATVQLPQSYLEHPGNRYPVVFDIPGFGGSHHIQGAGPSAVLNDHKVEFIRVWLDPNCAWGHHVFANSATNGPYGDALVEEFLPALDAQYRTIPEARGRFLSGHSSGGWSSLWVQVTHPEVFGGTWSTSPDPVDFRDFQRIDIYRAGENMFVDSEGQPRPLARMNGKVIVNYQPFSQMEQVLGHGGQLMSFEAVFSPLGPDGQPQQLWHRDTGEIDLSVAEAWKKYDIRLLLEHNWDQLKPLLAGKIHVYMGTEDTFYLEGATKLLKEALERLESDAVVELFPGRDHFNLFQGGLRERIDNEMATQFLSTQ